MLECKEVKEYLDSIGLPYDEKETGDMKVLQMQYNQGLCAIFPPVDDCPKYSVILAYNGAVQRGPTMDLDQLKGWIYKVWILNSEDYVYEDEPKGQVVKLMSKWRIKEIFSPKHNITLYIPQYKGLFFYNSFTYHDYCEYIEKRHNMTGEFELVWDFPYNRVGFKTADAAKEMIDHCREYWRILAEHEEAEKKARKKGKKIKPKYIEVD